jgi:hypothetical protein
MNSLWKTNWPQTQQHFIDWWNREGLVLGYWGTGIDFDGPAHADAVEPIPLTDPERFHMDPQYVAQRVYYEMAHKVWPADVLPVAWPDIGTVTLAPYLGAIQKYEKENIWYGSCILDPNTHPPLHFDPAHPYSRTLEAVLRKTVEYSRGHYFVGMPAIVPNLDVLAELRGTENLLMDMIERPVWIHEKLQEIETAFRQVFDDLYEIVKADDGSMAFGYFMLWGPGKTGLLQCDAAAMFSPKMFDDFVIPYIRQSVEYLDYSMFHVDGHQCLGNVDSLLEIEGLDAIEWTPDPQVPPGGSPHWFDLYKKILNAGKSIWVANMDVDEVIPLLDAVGPKGVYLNVISSGGNNIRPGQMEQLADKLESYRH